LLGNQVGNGSGKNVATIAGAAGGAYLGHELEKSSKGSGQYVVTVRMQDGKKQKLSFASAPSWRQGDRVMVQNGQLVAMR
jgi:outer membrane lipoprotein SlyB